MSNRLFQGIIHQMKDAVGRVIGVIDETGIVISCSELGKIGEARQGVREELTYASDVVTLGGYTYRSLNTATKNEYIVFVEVKTRTVTDHSGPLRFGTAPANAVDAKKKEHIKSAAQLYLKENKHRKLTRFDIIEVYLNNEGEHYSINRINHIPRAFGAGIDKR